LYRDCFVSAEIAALRVQSILGSSSVSIAQHLMQRLPGGRLVSDLSEILAATHAEAAHSSWFALPMTISGPTGKLETGRID